MIINVKQRDKIEAHTKYLLTNGERLSAIFLKDLKLNADAISININVNKATVLLISSDKPKILWDIKYEDRVIKPIKKAVPNNNFNNSRFKIFSLFLGFSSIISFDVGFTPKVKAGKLSVTRFINRICIETSIGVCHPNTGASSTPKNNVTNSAKLQLSW